MAQVHGTHPQLLQAVMDINSTQRKQIILKLEDLLHTIKDKTIGVLGLAFKQDTDDLRESPSLDIARVLHERGAKVRGYDPVAMEHAAKVAPYVELCEDPYKLAEGCDALVVATPWNEFKALDMGQICRAMKQPIMVDGRNLYDPALMKSIGFVYRGVGRGFKGAMENGNGKDSK
jgi:UDPglucose 6-dehydrogenase